MKKRKRAKMQRNKTKIGLFRAMGQCARYGKMEGTQRQALQEKRMRSMVEWAKENSPYYAKLYKESEPFCKLSDLPSVNKTDLMEHWEDWVTDRGLKRKQVQEFMDDLDNVGRKFKGEYLVFTTSGSTGNPLVVVCDDTTSHIMGAVNAVRSFSRKEDMRAFIKRGGKSIGVFATGGFYLSNCSVRARLLSMPWKKRQIAVTSALLPIAEIVEELNAFQPAMLGGYPSNLELLIAEQKSGRLHINPVIIMTGGEYLSESLRKRLAEAFGCYVQTSYSCTEGGSIGCECREGHFHVNDDWIIVEPVDEMGQPVPNGVRADKILLTNLFNFTQPFIRYEVSDRVIMQEEPCRCGNPSPWLTLEGRSDDVVSFQQDGKEIKIPPLALYATLKEVHKLSRFQLVADSCNNVELRLEPMPGVEKQQVFCEAKQALEAFLLVHGLNSVNVKLSQEAPEPEAGSGKFKHIIRKQ